MKVAILQSNYIPWKGYFDIIKNVELFIFHDDLQYTKNDWRNRNRIITDQGLKWLTIPVGTNEKRLICEVLINNTDWQKEHFRIIQHSYRKSEYYTYFIGFLEELYLSNKWDNLSTLNQFIIKELSSKFLNLEVQFDDSRNYNLTKTKAERVMELLSACNATEYLSGPSARNYLKEEDFERQNIKLNWMNYNNYPEYKQLSAEFYHNVSVIDLIFHTGPNAYKYLNRV